MIDIDNWMRELEEEEDLEIKNNEEYQHKSCRGRNHQGAVPKGHEQLP